tara:strand:- start:1021 stop:2409 length:1389 start_codon:yes stop_codon:yes gene_type:complete
MPDAKFVAQLTHYFTNVVEAPKSEARILQLADKYATNKGALYVALKKKFGKRCPKLPAASGSVALLRKKAATKPPLPPRDPERSDSAHLRALIEKQVAAQPASRDATVSDSVSACEVTAGGGDGAHVCKHCWQRFESCDDELSVGGCPKRLFHPGRYQSGTETVWNGPDYMQYDRGDGGWDCCSCDYIDPRNGCRTLRHEFARAVGYLDAGADLGAAQPRLPRWPDKEVAKATGDLKKLVCVSALNGCLHGEADDGRTAGSWRSPDQEIAARTLIDDLGANVNDGTRRGACGKDALSLVALAAQGGHAAMLSLLFEKGAADALANERQVGFSSVRPLWLALRQNWLHPGHVRAAWVLCCHSANPRLDNGEQRRGRPEPTALELVPNQSSRDQDCDMFVLGAVLDRVFAAAIGGSEADPDDEVGLVSREPAKLAALFAEAKAEARAKGVPSEGEAAPSRRRRR